MRVLLVYPALSDRLDRFPTRPPLGMAYLVAVLKQHGHECRLIDEQLEPDLWGLIDGYRPQVVGFSVTTWTAPRVAEKVAALKQKYPQMVCLAGGPHATALPESLLLAGIDIVVRGYGEEILLDVLEALAGQRPLAEVAGIAFCANGVVVTTAPAAEPALNDLPLPDYDQLNLKQYSWCSVSSSRGCPSGCLFCSDSYLFGRRISLRTPADFVGELERLYFDHGVRNFYVVDEQFTFQAPRVMEICRLIQQKGLDLNWTVNSRVDCVTGDMLASMRAAGCRSVAFGVESGSDQILKTIHKGITPDHVERAVALAKQAGLRVKTSWIVGLPGSLAEQLKSIDLMVRTQPNHIDVYWLTVYPGTPFWRHPEKYGLHFDPRDVPLTANTKLASTSYYYDYLTKAQVLEVAEQMTARMVSLGYKVADLDENDYSLDSRFIATFLRYLPAPDYSHELSK
jgi:anaerobic magnesium-protoporphyrin IX monomethyl ester cyclase